MIATADICDCQACPALAAVEVSLPTGFLRFCTHHYTANVGELVKAGGSAHQMEVSV